MCDYMIHYLKTLDIIFNLQIAFSDHHINFVIRLSMEYWARGIEKKLTIMLNQQIFGCVSYLGTK